MDEWAVRVTPVVAAIDCGTNSVRLLVTDGRRDLHRETRIVRLGQGVDRTGMLAPDAIERTRLALVGYAAIIERLGAERVRFVATSATRDAANRADFARVVRASVGVDPEVVTGLAEAQLSYSGAVGTLSGLVAPVLLVDLGGGSTELVLGTDGVDVLRAHSMDIGSVRMTERHLISEPPAAAEIEAAEDDIRAAIDGARPHVPLGEANTVVGVAGTVTTLAAIALGLTEYDAAKIHGSRISAAVVRSVTEQLLGMNHAQRAAIPVIHPGRVDVIAAGALVLRTVLAEVGADGLVVSEHDILDGIANSMI